MLLPAGSVPQALFDAVEPLPTTTASSLDFDGQMRLARSWANALQGWLFSLPLEDDTVFFVHGDGCICAFDGMLLSVYRLPMPGMSEPVLHAQVGPEELFERALYWRRVGTQ